MSEYVQAHAVTIPGASAAAAVVPPGVTSIRVQACNTGNARAYMYGRNTLGATCAKLGPSADIAAEHAGPSAHTRVEALACHAILASSCTEPMSSSTSAQLVPCHSLRAHAQMVSCHNVQVSAQLLARAIGVEVTIIKQIIISDYLQVDKDTLWVTPDMWEQLQIMSNVEWTIN